MIRRKLAIMLTILMLHSNVALASVLKYDVSVGNNGNSVRCYSVKNLTDGFLDSKRGEKSDIYEDFIGNVKQGGYVAFEDDKGKVVDYNYVIQKFLQAKQQHTKFCLDEVLESAPSMSRDGRTFTDYGVTNKPVDVETGAPTAKDVDNTSLTPEDKEKAKEMLAQQQGGISKEDIKDTAKMIEESMDSNMPKMSKAEIKDLNLKVTDGSYREDIWKHFTPYDKNQSYLSIDLLGEMGLDKLEKNDSQSLRTIDRRLKIRKLIKDDLSKNPKYSDLFDLDNYENFKNMTIDFSNLNKVNHEDFPKDDLFTFKTKEDMKGYKGLHANGEEGRYHSQAEYISNDSLHHSFMWKPYLERDFIETINKMRIAKGAKPLEYDVNLHAMARFSVKRSTMGFNHTSLTDINGHDSNQLHYKFWANGSIPYCRPYEIEETNICSGWGNKTDGVYRNLYFGSKAYWLDKLEGNEKELFNYDGKVRAMSDMDIIYDDASQWLESLNLRYNRDYNSRGHRDYYLPYCKKMNFDRDLLDPSLTKIGVGVMCELPVCNRDVNGATGFFIITE